MSISIVYPPGGRITFDGGKNSKFERSIIADNESPDCVNVVFTNGAVETVAGTTKLNTSAVASFVNDGLYTRHDNSGAETMVGFWGGSMYQLAGSTFTTVPSAQSVFTAGTRVGATEYENHLFLGNGAANPYKYNGTDFTRHGVPAATGAVSMASATTSTGVLTGSYQYVVTFVNSQAVEGNPGTATVTTTLASGMGILTGIPVAPTSHGVSARRIYRATATTAGAGFFRVAEIADNTTTTYVDNIPDASLGAEAPDDNGEPPKYSVAAYHQNRIFCNDASEPNLVWYSELAEPYTFGSLNFRRIGDASGDIVRTIEVYQNAIFVGCDNSQVLIFMPSTDPADWAELRIKSQYGSKSPFANFLYNNSLAFAAMQNGKLAGFAAVTGSTIDPTATILDHSTAGSDLKSDRIEPDMFQVQETFVGNISSMVFKNKAYIALTYGSNQTENNRIYVFDFSSGNLGKKQEASWAPLVGLSASQFTVYDGKLYYGSSTDDGFVYQLESSNFSFDGSAITSYFWTKEFSGRPEHETLEKDFRTAELLIEKAGAYNMNFTYRVDSDKGVGLTQQVSLDPGGSIFGSLNWGGGVWGGGTDQDEVRIPLGAARGRRIQFKFGNQGAVNQRFKVHGMKFTYNIKGKR